MKEQTDVGRNREAVRGVPSVRLPGEEDGVTNTVAYKVSLRFLCLIMAVLAWGCLVLRVLRGFALNGDIHFLGLIAGSVIGMLGGGVYALLLNAKARKAEFVLRRAKKNWVRAVSFFVGLVACGALVVLILVSAREQLEDMGWQAHDILTCTEWAFYVFSTICYVSVRFLEGRYGRRFYLCG